MATTNAVTITGTPTKPETGRLRILAGVLVVCCLALLIIWWRNRPEPGPPPTASNAVQRAYWQKRLKNNVADTAAYLHLGIMEERSGFYTAAVKDLVAARALGAPDTEICGPLGRAFTQLARDEEALPELEKAVKLDPHSAEAASNLAGLYVNQERPDLAAKILQGFVAQNPDLTPADANRIGLALLVCGDSKTARTLAEKTLAQADDPIARSIAARGALAAKDFKTARTHLEAMLKVAPDDTGALFLHGNMLDALGDQEGALKDWKRAVDLNPRAVDIYERIGDTYAARKDFARAAVAYTGLASHVPTGKTAAKAAYALTQTGQKDQKERAAYWGAVAAGFSGNFPEALRLGKTAAASADPDTHRLGLQAMAEAYRGMRQREPFLATMREMTKAGTLDDLILMAHAYEQADHHQERSELLERAAKLAPSDQRSGLLQALGSAYRTRGMRDQAEKALEEAIAQDPKNIDALNELGIVYYDRRAVGDRLERAISAWEQARALAPEDATVWEHLGIAYLAAGKPVKATQYLEHAIDLEPGSGPVYFELSKAYAALGDNKSAAQFRSLYVKYVTYEQNRQTLRTRAYRPGATAAQVKQYADMMLKIGALEDAAQWYERVLALDPKDAAVRQRLIGIYEKLRRVDRVATLSMPTENAR